MKFIQNYSRQKFYFPTPIPDNINCCQLRLDLIKAIEEEGIQYIERGGFFSQDHQKKLAVARCYAWLLHEKKRQGVSSAGC
jgi:hypothetical protein